MYPLVRLMGSNMKIRRKDHAEIKAYLINYINTLWNNNKNFVQVYGRDYPKTQLEHNLREFKFNKSTLLSVGGEYDLVSKNVYVYNSKYPIYSLDDLKKSPIFEDIMLTLLHELLHAVFSRNLDTELDANKLMTGLEIYDHVLGKVINSPLNEGYTEYLRSKLDKSTRNSYKPYVRIFNLLEKKIGRKGVIALAKGDVLVNLAKAFNMTPDEFMEFSRNNEKKFIRQRKLEVLESEYEKFCEDYPRDTKDTAESQKAIIKFDKSVHKCLYGTSILEILPEEVAKRITLEDFHEFMKYKIREIHKQTRAFNDELYNITREACIPKRQSPMAKLRGNVFGFIKIYNPEKKDGNLMLEYYALPEKEDDDKAPQVVSGHEVFVSSLRKRALETKSVNVRKVSNLAKKYIPKEESDIDY